MSPVKAADLRLQFPFVSKTAKLNFGDGWFRIVMGLCGALKFQGCDDLVITEVEMKDWKLNIEYTGKGGSNVDLLIAKAEHASTGTCDKCGAKGSPTNIRGVYIYDITRKLCGECLSLWEQHRII